MDNEVSSIDFKILGRPSDSKPPTKDACRICWNKIIGEGFHINSKVNPRSAVTYAQMFLHVSEIQQMALQDPESLCWGCSKILINAYRMMKRVEEREKIISEPKPLKIPHKIERKKTNIIPVDEEKKPSLFEMVVVKVEPQDFSDNMENSDIEPLEFVDENSFDNASSEDSDSESEDEEEYEKKRRVRKTPKKNYLPPTQYKNLIQCALCIYNTRNKENYKKHVLGHHAHQKLKCDSCNEVYQFVYDMETHRKEEHNATEKYLAQVVSNPAVFENRGSDEKLIVKHEIFDLPLPNSVRGGEEKQYKLDCIGRKIPINRTYKKGEVKWPRKERKLPIQCPLCPYTGIGKSNFRNHYRRLHNKQELQCDGCEAKFHLFYRLSRHREEEHNFSHEYVVDESLKLKMHEIQRLPRLKKDDKEIQCQECDQVLKGPRKLSDHLKEVHNIIKKRPERVKEICSYCGKFVANLEYHIRHLHSEYRDPYICHYCGDKLKSKTTLMRHMQSSHKLALSQRGSPCGLVCRFCPEVFRTKHLRVAHEVRIHTFEYKFKCSLCDSKFLVKSDFTKHLNRHAKGKMKQSRLNCSIGD
ncbi:PR domain zinc finger protein 5-like [Culicoides brevitarsis]|uniref:PR domain zinc finger protein 5-like n=1 Tax=Culicoides brevitarsis TaxID=469753 RepID=UPI00307C840E